MRRRNQRWAEEAQGRCRYAPVFDRAGRPICRVAERPGPGGFFRRAMAVGAAINERAFIGRADRFRLSRSFSRSGPYVRIRAV